MGCIGLERPSWMNLLAAFLLSHILSAYSQRLLEMFSGIVSTIAVKMINTFEGQMDLTVQADVGYKPLSDPHSEQCKGDEDDQTAEKGKEGEIRNRLGHIGYDDGDNTQEQDDSQSNPVGNLSASVDGFCQLCAPVTQGKREIHSLQRNRSVRIGGAESWTARGRHDWLAVLRDER